VPKYLKIENLEEKNLSKTSKTISKTQTKTCYLREEHFLSGRENTLL
jgi:hypothetical protein